MTLKEQIAIRQSTRKSEVMYTSEGASFQEWALSLVSNKQQASTIGALVTAINNGKLTVLQAKAHFAATLFS